MSLFGLLFFSFHIDYMHCKGNSSTEKKYQIECKSSADEKRRFYEFDAKYIGKSQKEAAFRNTCRPGERKHFHCNTNKNLECQDINKSRTAQSVCPVNYPRNTEKTNPLRRCDKKDIEHHRKVPLDIISTHSIGITYPYELFGIFFLVFLFHYPDPCEQINDLYAKSSCPNGLYKYQQKSSYERKIKNKPENDQPFHISGVLSHYIKIKRKKSKRHKNKDRFICYSNKKHDKRGISDLDLVFFHMIHLHRLTACGRRRDITEKETDKRIFKAFQKARSLFEHPEHIMYDTRFTCNKQYGSASSQGDPPRLCTFQIADYLGELLLFKDEMERKKRYNKNKTDIQRIFHYYFYNVTPARMIRNV